METTLNDGLTAELQALTPRAQLAFAAVMAERAVAEVAGISGFTDAHFEPLVYAVALVWEAVDGRLARGEAGAQLTLVREVVSSLAQESNAAAERAAAEAVGDALLCALERDQRVEHAMHAAMARSEALDSLYIDPPRARDGETRWRNEAMALLKRSAPQAALRVMLQSVDEFERGATRS